MTASRSVHESVARYVAWALDHHVPLQPREGEERCRVLEVGSYNVNGTIRDLFRGCYYRGVDIRSGPGVDHVIVPHKLPWPAAYFDVTVSTETLEHDPLPWRTVAEMARVTAPGGSVILTMRAFTDQGCYPYHDFPSDHWRCGLEAFGAMAIDAGLEILDLQPDGAGLGNFLTARA